MSEQAGEQQRKPSSYFNIVLIVVIVMVAVVLTTLARQRDNWPGSKALRLDERPLVAYLAPADALKADLSMAVAVELGGVTPGTSQQITFSPNGVFDFSVSPDGTQVAYTQPQEGTRYADILLLDLETGEETTLIDCPDTNCTNPVWHPEGDLLAYEQTEFVRQNVGDAIDRRTRVWIADLREVPPARRPLFDDEDIISRAPEWSPDGLLIGVFSPSQQAVIVYDFEASETITFQSNFGVVGTFSPDSTRLIYPVIVPDDSGIPSVPLYHADLTTGESAPLNDPDARVDHALVAWSPNGDVLAVGRRDLNDDLNAPRHIVLLDADSGEEIAVVLDDPDYDNGSFVWNADGTMLLVIRFDRPQNADTLPEIWLVDLEEGVSAEVVEDAYHARWLP